MDSIPLSLTAGDVVRQLGHRDKLVVDRIVRCETHGDEAYCRDQDQRMRAVPVSDLRKVKSAGR